MAGTAAPAAITPGMISAHTGVLQVASRPVTRIQNTVAKEKKAPNRNAHRRFRKSRARGSDAALSFCAATSTSVTR